MSLQNLQKPILIRNKLQQAAAVQFFLLADPYTLGVSAGAAFGASLAILFNIGLMGSYSVPLFAFDGAHRGTLFLLYFPQATKNTKSVITLNERKKLN